MQKLTTEIAEFSTPQGEHDWQSWMECGQEMALQQQWEAASIFYKRAFMLAEQNYCNHCPNSHCCRKLSLHRYLSSATEFASVMKNNAFDCALDVLIETLDRHHQAAPEEEKKFFVRALEELKRLAA